MFKRNYSNSKYDDGSDSDDLNNDSENTYECNGLILDQVENESVIKKLDIEQFNRNEDRTINTIFGIYHVRAGVIGSSGSGKTTFTLKYLLNLCRQGYGSDKKPIYGMIIYCAPTETLNSGLIRTIIDSNVLGKFLYPIDIRKDSIPTISELQDIQRTVVRQKRGTRIALILDDFINVLTSKADKKQIDAYLTQTSRASCDVFLLMQTYNNITPSIATNINVLILFLKYISRDTFNAVLRRSYTGEIDKEFMDIIFNELKHTPGCQHEPFIFINDQPPEKSIRFNDYYIHR